MVKLGNDDIFLGHDWLSHHNPSIDWFQGTLHFDRCPGQCRFREEDLEKEEPKDEAQKWLASIVPDRPSWVEERVTQRYLDRFKGLFSEKGFDRLPKRRPWDHAIELSSELPNAKLISIEGAGHGLLTANTARICDELMQFFEKNGDHHAT